MEPPHSYVRETVASVVHHADYLSHRGDHALCGVAFEHPTTLTDRADAICPDCEAKLVLYHLEWWREKAQEATAELDELRVKYRELADSEPHQPESPSVPIAEEAATVPKTLLEHARRDLTELCRQFDGAVPYVRLKNTMQAFSDSLDTDQRVLLAQEIGGDGTLIRWSTTEVVALGWHVSNSPVQGDSDAQWDAWIEDTYQAPKKTKKRFGRSR